jgi:hypothetical protein
MIVCMTGWLAIAIALVAAVIAGLSALSAKNSADEARMSRLDEGGPIVTLLDAQPLVGRWVRDVHHPYSRVPVLANARITLHTPADKDVGLYLAARLRIHNEATVSAFLEFPRWFEFEGEVSTWPKPRSDGRFPIAPGSTMVVTVFAGDSLNGWIAAGGRGRVSAPLSVFGTDPEVRDEFHFDLTGLMVDAVPSYDATWVLAGGMKPEISFTGPTRRYPERERGPLERIARFVKKQVLFVKDQVLKV